MGDLGLRNGERPVIARKLLPNNDFQLSASTFQTKASESIPLPEVFIGSMPSLSAWLESPWR